MTTETKPPRWTPGPWIKNGKAIYGWRIDSVSPDAPVGLEMLQNPIAIVPKEENADLIAAAPDLYRMLRKVADGHAEIKEILDLLAEVERP